MCFSKYSTPPPAGAAAPPLSASTASPTDSNISVERTFRAIKLFTFLMLTVVLQPPQPYVATATDTRPPAKPFSGRACPPSPRYREPRLEDSNPAQPPTPQHPPPAPAAVSSPRNPVRPYPPTS